MKIRDNSSDNEGKERRNAMKKIVTYTDGSFYEKENIYTYGAVLLDEYENKLAEIINWGNKKDFIESRQIPGEVLAVIDSIQYALDNGYSKITICYDYIGIYEWAVGNWATKKPIARYYKKYLESIVDKIQISFYKVTAHSGNKYNEEADRLALYGRELYHEYKENKGKTFSN